MKVVVASSFHQEGRPGERPVKELMTRDLHGVSPDTDLYTIAHIFIAHRIRRVPVVEHGELVGIVSRRDVLRVMRDLVN
jgi:CBS domain-containing protein